MTRIYIASDFHLKFSESKEVTARQKKVISFLESLIGEADLLILNGDIFDLWFVWKSVIIKGYFPILKKLADLKESGCRIVFIAGNHDFWFGDFLTDFLQMEVHQEYFSEILNGKKYFFAHGDRYTTNDWRYQVFRTIIRSRIVMKIFELFHPDVALNIGKKLSRSSRFKKIPHKLQRLREIGLENSARKKLERFDVVVFGHSHLPKMKKFENGIYLNSGDWLIHNSYIRSLNGDLQICYYDVNDK